MAYNFFKSWISKELNKQLSVNNNKFNEAFFRWLGGRDAQYDYDNKTYMNDGYGKNPLVYSVVKQQADKLKSIPIVVKKIKDKNKFSRYQDLNYATKGNFSQIQLAEHLRLKAQSFDEVEMKMPFERPNALQSWADIKALAEVYLKLNGNAIFYAPSPEDGLNKGVPTALYALPSHLMKIVLKKTENILLEENPIEKYMLIEGNAFIEFDAKDIIHVKYTNPFFDFEGGHLYGLSPIKSLLRNIESSNAAIDHNVKTMLNSGVYGFISGKDRVLDKDQAEGIKQKLREMKLDKDVVSNFTGSSVPIEFTKLSVSTDELKPFDFLAFDQKQICNVLGWSDKLLNNDSGAKYENIKEEKKRVLIDTIIPDCVLIQEALNHNFIKRFKGYENAYIEFDYTELPEIQEDIKTLVDWLKDAPVTPNEFRQVLKYDTIDSEEMNVVWISNNKKRIDELGLTSADLQKSFEVI